LFDFKERDGYHPNQQDTDLHINWLWGLFYQIWIKQLDQTSGWATNPKTTKGK